MIAHINLTRLLSLRYNVSQRDMHKWYVIDIQEGYSKEDGYCYHFGIHFSYNNSLDRVFFFMKDMDELKKHVEDYINSGIYDSAN